MTDTISSHSASITISFPDGRQVIVPNCEVTLEISRQMIDATAFGDVNHTYVVGVPHYVGTFSGNSGTSVREVIAPWDQDPTATT